MAFASTSNAVFYETPMASDPELPPSPNASRTNIHEPTNTDDDTTRRSSALRIPTEDEEAPDPNTDTTPDDPPSNTQPKSHGFLPFVTRPLGNFNPSLILENSGSVARDHLASERTFLAYVRTSLTLASAGIALFQLFALSNTTSSASIHKYARPIGATVVAFGIVVLVLGVVRYFAVQVALVKGVYPVARISPAFLSVGLLAIISVIFGILAGIRNDG
ncbi:hypothetical protein EIP91_002172 [Steccherinum ochraceum]|uniref:DUF202 domain-containing protein n=1 Tax=Steccherinum ochraceum TaxID=92696 RepID=A0A4R0REU3_9APHY|nr:hypothetical protein EIP91_002172 [Steccherinum ochraceum]